MVIAADGSLASSYTIEEEGGGGGGGGRLGC